MPAPNTSTSDHSLLDDLARPEAYPAPRPGRVTVAATHASWVFLTDTEAWKVKRPVNLGFLDFSTPDKRRRSCEDEVRLGARLAREIYLGVAPIYRSPRGHTFVGRGAPVDHAVRMKRLDDDQSAEALLARDRLCPPDLERLARRLAAFYASVPATPALGAPAILAVNMAENEKQLRSFGRIVDHQAVEALYHWQQGQLFTHQARLYQRITADRIREGHGDLRLEHVYFPQPPGEPLVIDPIDFNRAFRCADVALDVAFLAMELDAAARPDLAAFFLSCFARATNDYAFYPLLDLYLSYRAEVRAKVACLVAADASTPADKARRKREQAERLIELALSYRGSTDRVRQVLVVSGQIGTGKSTLADLLGRTLRLPVVSSDAVRKHQGGVPLDRRGGPELYTEEATRRAYQGVMNQAQPVLDSGRGVILDATFPSPQTRALARGLASANRCPFLLVELAGGDDLLRQRLRRREAEPSLSDAREALLPQLQRRYQPPAELSADERLSCDAALAPDALAGRVAAALARPARC
jgi:aminoglycoside phosphotransferase family enzyme/predicted kinase